MSVTIDAIRASRRALAPKGTCRRDFVPALEAELDRFVAPGAVDHIDLEALEVHVRHQALKLAVQAVERRLNADLSDRGKPSGAGSRMLLDASSWVTEPRGSGQWSGTCSRARSRSSTTITQPRSSGRLPGISERSTHKNHLRNRRPMGSPLSQDEEEQLSGQCRDAQPQCESTGFQSYCPKLSPLTFSQDPDRRTNGMVGHPKGGSSGASVNRWQLRYEACAIKQVHDGTVTWVVRGATRATQWARSSNRAPH